MVGSASLLSATAIFVEVSNIRIVSVSASRGTQPETPLGRQLCVLCVNGASRDTSLHAARGSFVDNRRSALVPFYTVRKIDTHVSLAETLPVACSAVRQMAATSSSANFRKNKRPLPCE